MKAPDFNFAQPVSVEAAIATFNDTAGDAIYIAGGQSVMPSLNLRLQSPDRLIDLTRIKELSGVSIEAEFLRIGALTTHSEVLSNALIAKYAPLLQKAAPFVAHPAIRNRGTIGGSIALADPASEFPAVVLALAAEIIVMGPDGLRTIAAEDFFLDLYETALNPEEILMAIRIPIAKLQTISVFDEFARRRGDYAMVGCAIQSECAGGSLHNPRIAFLSVGPTPVLARGAASQLDAKPLDMSVIQQAQKAMENDLDPMDDPFVPRAMRMHLARVLLGRLLSRLQPMLDKSQ